MYEPRISNYSSSIANLVFISIGLLFSVNTFGALNAYLTLVGEVQGPIQGDVTQAGREDSIQVIGYSHENEPPRDVDKCRNPGAGHNPLTFIKEIDSSTPLLYAAVNSGESMTEFTLRFWQPSPTGEEVQHYTIELINARLVGIKQEMLNNKYPENMQHRVREQVSVAYDSIVRTWEDGGISSSAQWDQACK